jgi:hypothetical protein
MSRLWRICALLAFALLGACTTSDGNDGGRSAGAGGASGGFANAGVGAGAGGVAGAIAGAGAGGGAGASAGAGGGAGAGGAGTAPTFTRVWNEVLQRKGCAGEFCHGSGQGGLSMDSQADAYANLVGKVAAGSGCGTSGKLRVVAGDAAASLLLDKISNPMPACGNVMPLGTKFEPNCLTPDPSVCTTQVEIQLVRDWITAGALDN